MLIKYFLLAVFFFISLEVYSEPKTQAELEKRLFLQQKYRINGWCLVPYNGIYKEAQILEIGEDDFTVRIIDTSIPIPKWPKIVVPIKLVKSDYSKTHRTLDSLVSDLKAKGIIKTLEIEQAFIKVDRKWFCPEHSYHDAAINIGCDAVISSPHMHIYYLEFLKDLLPKATSILDIGSGSGYLTAMLAYLSPKSKVIGIDYHQDLIDKSINVCSNYLSKEVNNRIQLIQGDGINGYSQSAPYDIICVGFMCEKIPSSLIDQLKNGGRLIIPIKKESCSYEESFDSGSLYIVDKSKDGVVEINEGFSCSFVPAIKDSLKLK